MSEDEKSQVLAFLLMLGALFIAIGGGLAFWVRWWAGAPVIVFGVVWVAITFQAAIELGRGGGTPCS